MRLFVAVWPPDDVLDLVAALPRADEPALRWTTRDQWHITLRFLGQMDEPPLLTDVARARRTRAVMGPAVDRFGRRVLHVPVAGLDDVADTVLAATAGVGRPPEDRPFHGHLTLARARDRRGADLRPLCGVPVSAEWDVEEVCLVESRLSSRGARYEVIDRVALSR